MLELTRRKISILPHYHNSSIKILMQLGSMYGRITQMHMDYEKDLYPMQRVKQLTPPSVLSIENRGNWSMGAVLDVYLHFSKLGDHFFGRVLARLDPNKSEFATLPPHFKKEGNLMGDLDIKEAIDMMYHQILDTYNGEATPTGLLLFVLDSVIYHSAWQKKL